MAIEIQPESAQVPSGREPAAAPKARPWWLRPAVHTALIGAIIGYALGHLLGNAISSGYQQLPLADSNDTPIVLGYLFGILGWLIGLGVFNDPVRQIVDPSGRGALESPSGQAVADTSICLVRARRPSVPAVKANSEQSTRRRSWPARPARTAVRSPR